MKIPFLLYAVGLLIMVFLGFSIHKERQLKAALERTRAAEREAQEAGHEANRKTHAAERARLEAELAHERSRNLSDRVADSYREYERRRAAKKRQ